MGSSATTTVDLDVAPEQAVAAVRRVVAENRFTPGEASADGRTLAFRTRKTLLSWELDAVARVEPTATGSRVEITADTRPDRGRALLDGAKNRKAVERLADQLRAAAS
jgi:hypothetical protein